MARAGEVGGSIDTERYGVNERDVNAHACLERTKLLKLLAPFERRRRERDETAKRFAPIGIDADVVVERAFAVRRSSPGEIEGAQDPAAMRGADHLHHIRVGAFLLAVVFFARRLVPPLLQRVVRSRSRELFLTFLLVLCLGTAYLTSLAGLSLALGAFLAGLAVSESEYSHQALAEAIPFRDAFGSLPRLPQGSVYVDAVRRSERERTKRLEERWRSR